MNTYSVLILDDEEFSVDVLMEDIHWEKCGISQVHGVYSVRQAKEFLKKNAVNILICDIEMPGENGLDLVEWAMEYARFSKDPMICIMLTCHPEYSFLRKAMQLGCQDYLLKPVDEEDLEASLKKSGGGFESPKQSLPAGTGKGAGIRPGHYPPKSATLHSPESHGAFYRVGACTECFPESSIHDASFQKRDQHVCAGICDGAADSCGQRSFCCPQILPSRILRCSLAIIITLIL